MRSAKDPTTPPPAHGGAAHLERVRRIGDGGLQQFLEPPTDERVAPGELDGGAVGRDDDPVEVGDDHAGVELLDDVALRDGQEAREARVDDEEADQHGAQAGADRCQVDSSAPVRSMVKLPRIGRLPPAAMMTTRIGSALPRRRAATTKPAKPAIVSAHR